MDRSRSPKQLIMKVLFILFLLLFGASSCYYDVESELYPTACTPPEQALYSVDIQPIISNSCAVSGCHVSGGTGTGNYQNFTAVQSAANSGALLVEVIQDRTMPPSSSLSDCDRQLIQQWVEEGALNN